MTDRTLSGRNLDPVSWLVLLTPSLLWAGNFIIGRAISGSFPPVALSFWRWVVALLVLLPFVATPLWRERWTVIAHWKILAALGVLGVAGYNTFVYLALQTTPSANAAVMNSVIPVIIPLFAWAIARERVTRPQLVGIAVSVAGALWIVARGDPAVLASLSFQSGDLWMLLAVVDWAIYSVLLRYRPARLPGPVFLAATILVGLVAITPFLLWELAAGATVPMTLANLGVVAYVGIFASVVAFTFWNRSVATLGANVTGLSVHLIPVISAVLAYVFLGERLYGYHLTGAALIVAGLVVATTLGRPRRPVAAEEINRR